MLCSFFQPQTIYWYQIAINLSRGGAWEDLCLLLRVKLASDKGRKEEHAATHC